MISNQNSLKESIIKIYFHEELHLIFFSKYKSSTRFDGGRVSYFIVNGSKICNNILHYSGYPVAMCLFDLCSEYK